VGWLIGLAGLACQVCLGLVVGIFFGRHSLGFPRTKVESVLRRFRGFVGFCEALRGCSNGSVAERRSAAQPKNRGYARCPRLIYSDFQPGC
jgi:hypothetical protein